MNSSRKALLLRADASTQIGAGHVMRCLALAQAWQDAGGQPHFAAAQLPEGLATRLTAEGIALHRLYEPPGSREDAVQTAALAQQLGAAWVVEDGYHFGTDYQRVIKDAGLRLLAIDDYGHAGHYVADLVLNQNIYAHEALYPSREPTTRLLLGTRYVLLRREFLRWRNWQRQIPEVARKVLVTMGGSDPDNVTLKVLQALTDVDIADLEVVVVVGASNPHLAALQAAARRSSHRIRIEQNATNMPDLMAWADAAVSSGGSTCWELAFMGVPTITLALAENQLSLAKGLANAEAVLYLGRHAPLLTGQVAGSLSELLLSPEKRSLLSGQAQRLVDGRGSVRLMRSLKQERLTLRSVQENDCALIWHWANDPVTRLQSFSSDSIPWEQHVAWFKQKLTDPNVHFFMAVNDSGEAVGHIRFQVDREMATVSINLAPEHRGKGYGADIIREGSQQIWLLTSVKEIQALIKPDNYPSITAFSEAGYLNAGLTTSQGESALRFVLRRSS